MSTPKTHNQAEKGASSKSGSSEAIPWWDRVVRYRWGLCVAFITFYYMARYESGLIPIPNVLEQIITWSRPYLLLADLLMIVVAGLSTYPAVTLDYLARLEAGLDALRQNPKNPAPLDLKDVLEHARWCNVKLYGVMTVILGVIGATLPRSWVPPLHEPVALAVTVLLLVALFDSLLDLEAEWTITMLSASAGDLGERNLAFLIWKTNQFRPQQSYLLKESANLKQLNTSHVTGTAQNIIMFAVAIIVITLGRIAWNLVRLF
jgi:hypothetical protein